MTWTLFDEISWSTFVGIGILVAFFILSSVILRVVRRVHAAQMTEKDKRLRLIRAAERDSLRQDQRTGARLEHPCLRTLLPPQATAA